MQRNEWRELHEYCLKLPCAYETRPFGEEPICYRIAGKIFAQLSTAEERFQMTLKTNPEAAQLYRSAYPGVITRGYHCPPVQQPYWNTIELKAFDKTKLLRMIDEAYFEVVKKLPKKEQKRLPGIAQLRFERKETAALGIEIRAYNQETEIALAGYRFYDEETVEIVSLFVGEEYRMLGIGKELVRRLEADARIAGYRFAYAMAGTSEESVYGMYVKCGYYRIPRYGKYRNEPEAICMSRKI